MKKDGKPDTMAVINNYNFCLKHTDGHGPSMTDPAQRADSVKILISKLNSKNFKVIKIPKKLINLKKSRKKPTGQNLLTV